MAGLVMKSGFWQNKRVLITGHTGFKGSWPALWLQQVGAQVIGYALPPEGECGLFEAARIADGMVSVEGDVRDLPHLLLVMEEHRPEVVFHLAAQSLVRRSYREPVDTFAINVMGTVNVLEAVRKTASVRAFVNVTSDKCYQNRELDTSFRETDPMGGYDPYSASKGCAELVTAAYRNSYFPQTHAEIGRVGIASARAGNVFGGGDWAEDRLVPDIMRAILQGEAVSIRNPQAIRPWQHVLEPLHGYLMLAEQLWQQPDRFSEGWNFGPADEDAVTVEAFTRLIADHWEGVSWEYDRSTQPHEAKYLTLNCSKARGQLGWQPILRLPDAVQWTVEWYQAARNNDNLRDMTLQQVMRYQQRVEELGE